MSEKENRKLVVPSASVDYWRQYENMLQELEQAVERDPARFAARLLGYVETLKRMQGKYVDYLRHRFGIKYRIFRLRATCEFRVTRTVTNPSRVPRTRRQKRLYEGARLQIVQIEGFFRELLLSVDRAERSGDDVDRAMCEAFLEDFRLMPAFYGVAAQVVTLPTAQEECVLALSAWLVPQICMQSPHKPYGPTRAAKALADENIGLLEALPPAAIDCFAGMMESPVPLRRPGGRKESLVSRVETLIARQGSEKIQQSGRLMDDPFDETIGGSEEFSAREEAFRQANELIKQAGLSPNEKSTILLGVEGHTQREIAERRGVTEGAIKTEKHRAVAKLKQTAKP